jgi:hypothetical protein
MATKKRTTKFDKQYLLSGDEMKALVDFMREVAGLAMSPTTDHGEIEVEGYLDAKICDAVDEVLHNHGIKL